MTKRAIFIMLIFTLSMFATGGTGTPRGEYTIVDEQGNVLLITGWRVHTGDKFISPDNKEYEVTRVRDRTATARFVTTLPPIRLSLMQPTDDVPDIDRPVVIYHTHTHESFVPTEGTDSILYRGSIIKVGNVLAEELEQEGTKVEHITTPHCPADSRAYSRSRRTVIKAIREHEPIALLDVHRDAAPRNAYMNRVNGQLTAQVLIVVGRYNPNRRVNTRFARQVKAVVDERAPGLIKGIFFARGTYNQDLSPRALLLELGSHLTTRSSAETGARIFAQAAADVLQPHIAVEPEQQQEAQERQEELERESELSAAGILALVAIGGTAFTVINQPRIRPIIEQAATRGQRRIARSYQHIQTATAPVARRLRNQLAPLRHKLEPAVKRIHQYFAPIRRKLDPGLRKLQQLSASIDRKVDSQTRQLRNVYIRTNRQLHREFRRLQRRAWDLDRRVDRRVRLWKRRVRSFLKARGKKS